MDKYCRALSYTPCESELKLPGEVFQSVSAKAFRMLCPIYSLWSIDRFLWVSCLSRSLTAAQHWSLQFYKLMRIPSILCKNAVKIWKIQSLSLCFCFAVLLTFMRIYKAYMPCMQWQHQEGQAEGLPLVCFWLQSSVVLSQGEWLQPGSSGQRIHYRRCAQSVSCKCQPYMVPLFTAHSRHASFKSLNHCLPLFLQLSNATSSVACLSAVIFAHKQRTSHTLDSVCNSVFSVSPYQAPLQLAVVFSYDSS